MSLFRKPRKQIQRRILTSDNDDIDDNPEEAMDVDSQELQAPPPPSMKDRKSTSKSSDKKPRGGPSKQPLLSFETEEEGEEVFQVKKSSHSKKVMKMFEKERRKKDLFKSDKVIKQPEKSEDHRNKTTEIITDDLILVVRNKTEATEVKTPPPPPILSGRDALCAGKDDMSDSEEAEDDDPDSQGHRFSKPNNFKKVLESGAIPDAAMIHAARKKRQRAREMGDFIPLPDEGGGDEASEENKGRLVREQDGGGSDSDDERIDMDVNLAKVRDQERRREQFLAAQGSDTDEVTDEWEHQQIRKGVTGAPASLMSEMSSYQEYIANTAIPLSTVTLDQPHPYQQQQQQQEQTFDPGVPLTPQTIAAKLREHYQSLVDSRAQNHTNLEETRTEIEQLSIGLSEFESKAPEAARRFRFYQELRGYVTDLVECLDEKVGLIDELEKRALDQMARKSDWLIERRRQDVRDQMEEVSQARGLYNNGGNGTVQGEEDKVRRAAEREGRRTRRRRGREATNSNKQHVEGMSSDDEISPQDKISIANNYDQECGEIQQETRTILSDVVEDYSSVAAILIKFEEWRETDITAYSEAYATLCLPKIVSPLIRLNLIFWDPLNESSDNIEKIDWYRTLALYGLHDDESEVTLANDPDINLLPSIIERLVIPKLSQLVDRCWDPLSNSQTLKLLGLVTRYIRKYPTLGPGSKSLTNLFNGVLHKMKCALENDVFIPLTPKIESKSQFFQRQFASGLKLLKNMTSWQGILNDTTLRDLALNSLLNRYLLTALKFCLLTDAVSKVKLISLILPRAWLLQDAAPELKMFSTCVANFAQQLDRNNPLHLESIETVNNILKTLR